MHFSTSSFPVSSSQHLHSNFATEKIMRFCFYLRYVLGVLLGKSDRFWKLVSILLPCLNGLRAVLLSVLDRLGGVGDGLGAVFLGVLDCRGAVVLPGGDRLRPILLSILDGLRCVFLSGGYCLQDLLHLKSI